MNLAVEGSASLHHHFTTAKCRGRRWCGTTVSRTVTILLAVLCQTFSLASSQTNMQSRDGYVRREGNDWVLGSSVAEKRIRLKDGQLVLASLINKGSGREYQNVSSAPAEIRFAVDGQDTSASNWNWTLRGGKVVLGKQGEIELNIELASAGIGVTKHYVVYPGTSVIREWLSIENSKDKSIRISQVDFLHTRVLRSGGSDLQFNYLTGGGNFNGSQLLKSEPMNPAYHRVLDSNGGIQPGSYSGFLPLVFLLNQTSAEGVAVGWDYLGHWRFEIGNEEGQPQTMRLELAGFERTLPPGSRVDTPKVFIAPFSGGVDELGNQLLDWQYGYLWDFTNSEYFAKTRWAVDWPPPWVGEGGTPSADNWGRRLALDLRYVDLLRETGTDILWDDAGWYDRWGTWNSPDWRRTSDYLRKHDMRWVLWYPTFLATPESKVAQQHPDWLIRGQDTLEQSIPATADWQERRLNGSVSDWGDFQWRYDIAPAASANDTDALAADQNFRKLLEQFKDDHPQSGIDACDGGGRWISYDIGRLAESGEYTDGGVGPYSAYYTSLVLPPDKLHNVVDYDQTYYADVDRAHLAMEPTWYRDPGDGPDVESIRKDWEMYHYLVAQGVAGRWSHVFRPKVAHDDPIWYFQRMNRDGTKGVILVKHEKRGPTYFVISRFVHGSDSPDRFFGGPGEMNTLSTTAAASLQAGIYQDPVDGIERYYGVPGQGFGPLNIKYRADGADESLVTNVVKRGAEERVHGRFFGMSLQIDKPMTITEIGQFDPGANVGTYSLSLVRAEDNAVLATVGLDMSRAPADKLGFKYARLPQPFQLESSMMPVVIYPRGLSPAATYDVRADKSALRLRRSGAELMSDGIKLNKVVAGDLIFLNLAHYPGSETDNTPPTAPSNAIKQLGTNLGVEGVELSWSPGSDDNWISYYEVLKNGKAIGKVAKGTYFFDHSDTARDDIDARFEIRTVDGDGNRSPAIAAQKTGSQLRVYEALGDFSPTQLAKQWTYEETLDDGSNRDLTWDSGGYEGRWAGSGLGRIGRIWMQPSARYDLSRTFVVPVAGTVSSSGTIRKDPSAENQISCFVRILLNSKQVWPEEGWAEVRPRYDTPTTYNITGLSVSQGDKLRFILKHNGQNRADPIVWNPSVSIQSSDGN